MSSPPAACVGKNPQPVAPKNVPGEELKISNYCTQSQLLNARHFMNPFLTKWGVYVKLFHGCRLRAELATHSECAAWTWEKGQWVNCRYSDVDIWQTVSQKRVE